MGFSEQYGYKKIREIIQIDSMDEPLRNALWNMLTLFIWNHVEDSTSIFRYYLDSYSNREIKNLCIGLWQDRLGKQLDQLGNDWEKVYMELRKYFFKCEWYEAYHFIEFVANNYTGDQLQDFIDACNKVMVKNVSAYRFIDRIICRITEQQEIDAVEQALDSACGPVRTHLRRSLQLLSNRETPDYRNSIKESISAVESLVATVVGVEKGTLGDLIKRLEDQISLHPALKAAFSKLYGYTSDEGGIRHALLEAETIRFEDAKFFIVVCSAFINYVEAKITK